MASGLHDLLLQVDLEDRASKQFKLLESNIIRTVGAITAAIAAVRIISFPIIEAAQYERAMADVAKTTGYSDTQISRLSDSLVEMSTVLGSTAQELAGVAAIAGQLGLGAEGRKAVEQFTESVARASVTLGLSVEQTAEGGAQLSAIFNKSAGEVERVFSTINELSNNSVAAGGDLIDIMKRVGTTAGLTLQQVAGLAAWSRQLGVPNEQAGTGLVTFFGNMLAEAKKFSDAMGITQAEWVKRVNYDAVQAFKDVTSKLATMDEGMAATLTKKLFGSGRLFSFASKGIQDASNEFEILNKMLGYSTAAFDDGQSSIREYEKIMGTVVKQIDVLKASFTGLSIEAGSKSLLVISDAVKELSAALRTPEATAYFAKLGEGVAKLITSIVEAIKWVIDLGINWDKVAAVLKALLLIQVVKFFTGLAASLKNIVNPIIKFFQWLDKFGGAFSKLGATFAYVGNVYLVQVASKFHILQAAMAAFAAGAVGLGPVLVRLGALLLTALGPVGVVAGLVATAIYFFKDDLAAFFGWVDKEEADRRKKEEAARKEVAKNRADAIAAAEEQQAIMDKVFNKDGTTKAADVETNFRVTANTEEAQKQIQDLATQIALLEDQVVKASFGGKAAELDLADQKAVFAENVVQINVYKTAIDQLAKRLADLTEEEARQRQIAATTADRGQAAAQAARLRDDIEEVVGMVDEYGQALSDLEGKQLVLQYSLQQSATSMVDFGNQAAKAQEALAGDYARLVAGSFDKQSSDVIRTTVAIKEQTAKVEELKKKQEELKQLMATKAGATPANAILGTETEEKLFAATKELERLIELKDSFMKDGEGGYILQPGQLDLIKAVENMDISTMRLFAKYLEKMEYGLGSGDTLTKQMRESAVATTVQYVGLKKLNEEYQKLAATAADYATTAKSALDNTATEIVALQRAMEKSLEGISTARYTASLENAEKSATNKIEKEYDKRRDKIKATYKELTRIASDELKAQLKEKEQHELDMLAAEEGGEVAQQKLIKLQALYNRQIEESKRLLEEAQKAAEAGDVDKALALKDASKDSYKEAGDIIKEIAKLSKEMPDGGIEFLVDDAGIQKLKNEWIDVGSEVGGAIGDVNQSAYDSAKEIADAWAESAATVASEFATVSVAMKNMEKTFSNVGQLVQQVTERMEAASNWQGEVSYRQGPGGIPEYIQIDPPSLSQLSRLTSVLEEAVSRNPYDAAQSIAPEAFAGNVRDAIKAQLEGYPADLAAEMGNQLKNISFVENSGMQQATATAVKSGLDEAMGRYTPPEMQPPVFTPVISQQGVEEQFNLMRPTIPTVTVDSLDIRSLKLPRGTVIPAGGGGGHATGGYISGPGTSTSDSIPAWLSNGEYVIDAKTTSLFGAPFFKGLQTFARGRASGISRSKGALPSFSGGGEVNSSATLVGSVIINLGGDSFTLYGERKQAKKMVDTFRRMSK